MLLTPPKTAKWTLFKILETQRYYQLTCGFMLHTLCISVQLIVSLRQITLGDTMAQAIISTQCWNHHVEYNCYYGYSTYCEVSGH